MTGVIEVNAVEYYANEFTDDREAGLADAFKMPDPMLKRKIIEDNKELSLILLFKESVIKFNLWTKIYKS